MPPAQDKQQRKPILISGASIAGLTLAYWLNRYGFEVTVVEKAAELRLGGQNIDVKGPAWEIAQKMGIAEKIRHADTTEAGIRFVDTKNKVLAEFPKGHPMSMTQELEILRGDLVKILYELTEEKVSYRFGDHITGISEEAGHTEVSFAGGKKAEYGLVLIAEGIGSSTRAMVFKDEVKFRYLGLYTAYFTIEKQDTDTRWARWCNAPGGIVFLLRPDPYGTTRASVTLKAKEKAYKNLDPEQQKKALTAAIKDAGWEAPRLTEEISKSGELYFERLSQVISPAWSKGRTAMTGDAAYCVTPIAGKGTDLAMLGPYILAGEIAGTGDHQLAFFNYRQKLESYVREAQKLPPGIPLLVYPESRTGVRVINFLFRIFGSRLVKSLALRLSRNKKAPAKAFELPVYRD